MKVLGKLESPNGITNHLYSPSGVLKAVFHSSPLLILILWEPLLKSILEKPGLKSAYHPITGFKIDDVILMMATHILHDQSFFGLANAGTTHGLLLYV